MEHVTHFWQVIKMFLAVYRATIRCIQWLRQEMESLMESLADAILAAIVARLQKALLVGGIVVVLSLGMGALLLRRQAVPNKV